MTQPVVYVPGLPASHLRDTTTGKRIFLDFFAFDHPRLAGPDDLSATEPIRADKPVRRGARLLFFDVAKQAQSLYELLARNRVEPVPVGWDWRRPVNDAVFTDPAGPWSVQPRLTAAIRDARRRAGRPVVVIVHSTGGLVLRALLEQDPSLVDDIAHVIAFGVPWAGTPRTLESIHGEKGFAIVSAARAQEILANAWAGWDLIPPDPTHLHDGDGRPLDLTYRETATGRRQVSALTDPDWIHGLPQGLQAGARARAAAAHALLGQRRPTFDLGGKKLSVTNVVGWGHPSPVAAVLDGTGSNATLRLRTEETQDATLDGGDGTVPRRSAAWLRSGPDLDVRTYHLPIGWLPSTRRHVHSRLWSNPGGVDLLAHVLQGKKVPPFCHAALDSGDSAQVSGTENVRVRVVALAADGTPLDDAMVRTRNLLGGRPIESPFDPRFAGRHLFEVPRARIPEHRTGSQRLRRLVVDIGWVEKGRRHWQTRRFTFFD